MSEGLALLPAAILSWMAGGGRLRWLWPTALLTLGLGRLGLGIASLLPLLGALGRRLLRRVRREVHRDAVRAAVPSLLTDLAMAAEAGQPLHAALRYARLYRSGPMADSLQEYLDASAAQSSIGEALEQMRRRLDTPETDRLIGLLRRDAQLGLPLAGSVARYRQAWLGAMRRESARSTAYMPYVFTALAGILLLEGVALLAIPWFASLWQGF